jgi:hypothetical protein
MRSHLGVKRSHLTLGGGIAILILVAWVAWYAATRHSRPAAQAATAGTSQTAPANGADEPPATRIYAHNLLLRKGPDFRVYIRWLNGQLVRTKKSIAPSFDDPESFILEVQKGIIHANIGDLSHFLNTDTVSGSPLTNISLTGNGNQISVHGTIHKLHIPLPIGLDGLVNYQAQLVNGYTRMTPQAGLQIFMPDVNQLPPQSATQGVTAQWIKNRNLPPPPDVPAK